MNVKGTNFPSDDYSWSTWSVIELHIAFSPACLFLSLSLCFSCRPLISELIRPSIPPASALFFPSCSLQLKEHIRSSSHVLPLITFIPIKLPRTENGREISAISRDLCTRFHRMVTTNDPSPDTYTLVFISAGFYVRVFLLLSLPLFFSLSCSMADLLSNILIDYPAISGYEFKSSIITIHTCFFSKFHLTMIHNRSGKIEIYSNGLILEWKF